MKNSVILLAPLPPPYGGIAGWTKRMLNAKLKNDWDVNVVDEKIIGDRTVFGKQKFNVFVELKRCLNIWKSLINELKKDNSKIVQACIPAGAGSMMREIFSAIITKAFKKKFIVHFRCTLPNMISNKFSLFIFNILMVFTDHVFVLNSASADFIKTHSNVSYDIIPNFIEKESLFFRKKVSHKIKNILYVGGVVEDKGCDLISSVAKFFPNITFTLIGEIKMNISKFPSNVICEGPRNREFINNKLVNTDVFLFLSRYKGEGFSNALAEAMAYSLPCVVTDWAANKDMIENKGGIVLENNNVECVKNAILSLYDSDIRKNMGNWNYKKIINYYLDEKVLDMYVDAYERLLNY